MIKEIIVIDETDGLSPRGMKLKKYAQIEGLKYFTNSKEAANYLMNSGITGSNNHSGQGKP